MQSKAIVSWGKLKPAAKYSGLKPVGVVRYQAYFRSQFPFWNAIFHGVAESIRSTLQQH
jgi:hypothetical protein